MSNVLKFPDDFLWGSAVSSYQVEGGIENSDWSRDYPAGKACDYYNQYEKYFDMAKDLGQNIHRLSLEWSRLEPEEGKFDKTEIEHYRKMLLALKARGIKSMVTIWQWTNPTWFAKKGGWENPRSSEYFKRFAKAVVPELNDLVDFWATLNEPSVYMFLAYIEGRFPPYKRNIFLAFKVYWNLARAHKAVYQEIHIINSRVKVGAVCNLTYISTTNDKFLLNRILVKFWRYLSNYFFLNFLANDLDYIGLNYYFHDTIEFNGRKFPFIKVTHEKGRNLSDIGWEIFPKGLYYILKDLGKYNLPIYITENGIADAADAKRAKFIIDHLRWTHKAISEGVDVRGYLYWSLLDNFEWTYRFDKRFGLIEMDFKTLEAKIRPSAYEYAKICKNNEIVL